MEKEKKNNKSIRFIFVGTMIFYIIFGILAIGLFSMFGTFVSGRIPPLNVMSFFSANKKVENTAPRQIIGSVESSDSVSYNFETEVPAEEIEPDLIETVPIGSPAEPEPEPEPVEPAEPEQHFYSFTSINSTTILHMRSEPSMDAPVIAKLKPGTKGYVMEIGDDWSRVWADGKVGYCSNEFLSLTEISKDEIPEEAVADDEAFITGQPGAVDMEDTGEAAEDIEAAPAVDETSSQDVPVEDAVPAT